MIQLNRETFTICNQARQSMMLHDQASYFIKSLITNFQNKPFALQNGRSMQLILPSIRNMQTKFHHTPHLSSPDMLTR